MVYTLPNKDPKDKIRQQDIQKGIRSWYDKTDDNKTSFKILVLHTQDVETRKSSNKESQRILKYPENST